MGDAVPTGDAPAGLVGDGSSVIVVHNYAKTVVRVSASGAVTPLASGPEGPRHPVIGFDSLWVVWAGGGVTRLNPTTGRAQTRLGPYGDQELLVATDSDVWVAGNYNDQYGWLWRINPTNNTLTSFPGAVGERVGALAYDGKQLWAATNCQGIPCPTGTARLVRVDPATGTPTKMPTAMPTDFLVTDAAAAQGQVWLVGFTGMTDQPRGLLVAIDSTGRILRSVTVGRAITGVADTADGLWVSDCLAGSVTLLDPLTGATRAGPLLVGTPWPVDQPFPFDVEEGFSSPGALAAAGNTLWVANWNDDAVVPILPSQ